MAGRASLSRTRKVLCDARQRTLRCDVRRI
nr:MAG TPA_asm: hypothetical protein [Caudoviricetes sp.]